LRSGAPAVSGGGSRAWLHPAQDLLQHHAANRGQDRAALLDQHVRLGAEEQRARRPGDQLPRVDVSGLQPRERELQGSRDLLRARAHLPDSRLDALCADPAARGAARAPGGPAGPRPPAAAQGGGLVPLADWPPWAGPVSHFILHEGLPLTAKIAAASVVGSAAVGIVLGTLLTIDFLPVRALIRLYIEVWRGLPLIVTLFIVFFALPGLPLHLRFTQWVAAAISLTLWGSAQVAEATRGAVESIPREQHEPASALGFGWAGRHAYVILPQASPRLLPPLVSLLVN